MYCPILFNWRSPFTNSRVVGWYFSFFIRILVKHYVSNSSDPDQTPRIASELGPHCLSMSHKKDARLISLIIVLILVSRYRDKT